MSLDFARKLFGIIVWATSSLCFTNETCLCITFWAVQHFPTLHGVCEHWIWLFVQKGNLQISSSWVRFAKIKKNKILKWLFHSGAQSSCLLVQHPREKKWITQRQHHHEFQWKYAFRRQWNDFYLKVCKQVLYKEDNRKQWMSVHSAAFQGSLFNQI